MSYSVPPGGDTYSLPNSNMAVISLITGILGITFFPLIGSVIAIITGIMARREIRESAGALGGDQLATAGLVLGWIGVALSVLFLCIFGTIFSILCAGIPWMWNNGDNFIQQLGMLLGLLLA